MIKADPNVVRFRRLHILYLACVILIAASMAALPALVAAKMGLPLYDLREDLPKRSFPCNEENTANQAIFWEYSRHP